MSPTSRSTWGSAYVQVLRTPGALAFSGAGGVARLPQAMEGLGSVLLVAGVGRSYTVAGAVAGALAISQAVVAPAVARLVDRRGQTVVVAPQLAVHLVVVAGLVVAAPTDIWGGWLVLLGAAAGASLPQIGPLARARWAALLGQGAGSATATAIESLLDEAAFVVAPALVGLLATTIAPAAGLIAAGVLALVATGAFLAQRRTEPPVHPPSGGQDTPRRPDRLVTAASFRSLVVVLFLVGMMFGLIEVGVVAFARAAGRADLSGVMLGLWALGSVLSGVVFGARHWTGPSRRRLLWGAAGIAAGAVLVALCASSTTTLTAALLLAGTANAPTLITANTIVSEIVPQRRLTEAYTWLSVAIFAGVAAGAPVAGLLVDGRGTQAPLWAAAVVASAAAVAAATGQRSLQPRTTATP